MKTKYTILILLGISTYSFAQESPVTSGGDISSSTGSVSFSLGQAVSFNSSSGSGAYNQGVQQVYIQTSLGTYETELNSIQVYPVPVTDFLNIMIPQNHRLYRYELFDMSGKKIKSGKTNSQKTELQFTEIPQGLYLLNLYKEENLVKTYKIIKK